MLLTIAHVGTKDGQRFYRVHTPSGLQGIIALQGFKCDDGDEDEIVLLLQGTYYRRAYPAGELDEGTPPRIRDLQDGYQTVGTFLSTWEHSTPYQREQLCDCQADIAYHPKRKKTGKWDLWHSEDRPRTIPGKPSGDGWIKVYAKDLRSALKGAKYAVRIGPVTVSPTFLRKLISTKGALANGPVLELREEPEDDKGYGAALHLRSGDGKARATVRHGAGDRRYQGANGFTARIAFVPA